MNKHTLTPSVSIIIPTLHRKVSLLRLLKSVLLNVDKRLLEIIIVEQNQNNKKEIEYLLKKQVEYKYIYSSTISTSKAKNIGARQAVGNYLLFVDDDVVVTKDLVKYHLQNYFDPCVAAVCGRSITSAQRIESLRVDTGQISYLGVFSDGYSSTVRQEIDTVIGCNASWRKNVFNEIGGFDEQFTGNAMREESDLSLRAKKAGYKILFEPKALVYHMRELTGGARKTEGRMQWYYHFLSNETYFFLKHCNKIFFPIFIITRMNWILRCMFGFGREVSLRSMVTPTLGIIDGFRKYRRYIYENRC
jgi:GT2 family glycosyltransferase